MKLNIIVLTAFYLIFSMLNSIEASAQEPDQMDYSARAEEETDRLQRILDLEDWQAFYVDSTLQHDLTAMVVEIQSLQTSKVSNMSIYQQVQDKWMDHIDSTYHRIFTEEQWAAYLKSGAAKAQKARDKRRQKSQDK